MRNTFGPIIGKKVHLGRLAVPVWALVLTVLVVVAAAGQAVGPVLSGSVTGKVGLAVAQTVLLDVDDGTVIPVAVDGDDDAVATVNDEGTEFTVAIETSVGQRQTVTLDLANFSGARANAILELNAPNGIDVTADDTGATSDMAQLSKTTYLFTLEEDDPDTDDEDIVITIESKDGATPGFYSISGRIIQVDN